MEQKMKCTSRNRKYLAWAAVLVLCCAAAHAQDVMLVANKDVRISAISVSDVRAIFTGEKTRFPDGSHAVPVILKGGPAHEVFVKNYCYESPNEFRAQWQKAIFTGQGAMPKAFDSEAALLAYVEQTPGAVGYVSRVPPVENVRPLVPLK
jgi:hypothetical protein